MEHKQLGTMQLEPHQEKLILENCQIILNGTYGQAVDVFEVIFEREPKGFDMDIFKALCELKLKEKEGKHYGIQGTIDGGKK